MKKVIPPDHTPRLLLPVFKMEEPALSMIKGKERGICQGHRAINESKRSDVLYHGSNQVY